MINKLTSYIINIPLQDLPPLSSTYPSLQEHSKLPTLLVQVWSQGDEAHSSTSIHKLKQISIPFTAYFCDITINILFLLLCSPYTVDVCGQLVCIFLTSQSNLAKVNIKH